MASAVASSLTTPVGMLGVDHFYRENQGFDTLSRKYQSSELFTPFQVPQRPTVSDSRYRHYRELLEKTPRVPWGMHREYAGEGPINLPDEHRPKSEPPTAVEKGHRHFGSGTDPYPRGLPIEQYYNLTKLKKSNIRSNDQLLPRPEKSDMTAIQIDRMFPAEHPYSSHMSRYAMFPSFSKTPDDYKTGEVQKHTLPKHHEIPSNPYAVTIGSKSKGSAHRWEIQELPPDSLKRALSWPGDVFFQNRKTPHSGQQQFYPVPPKSVLPNHAPRQLDYSINPRTANALRNVERSHWVTTYSKQYTGYGPANALALDNFDEKIEAEKKSGIEDHSLFQAKEHVNLPSETHDNFQDPAKKAQLQSSRPENIRQRQAEGGEPMNSLPLPDKLEKLKEPMKDLLVKHTGDLLELTENTRWRQAELQEHRDDLRLLKRKVDYTTPLLRPPVYYDTLHNIYSTKPPFYYDGENPYEYDYVGPWDYHKTNAIIDQYAKEGKQDETLLQSDASRVHPFDWEKYQFAGSPGKKAYVMPKYTGNQLLNGISRLEQSVAQKPIPQSNYVHSHNPDRIKSILTASDGKINLADLSSSLPTAYTSKRSLPTTAKSVQINGTVRVATGGGDEPLKVTDVPTAYPQDIGDNSLRVKGTYTGPVEYDVYRNSQVDARHINPQGARDRRFDWTADSIHRRDQTKLLDIQDSFTKSNTRDQFHKTFSESAPDLRNNVDTGKNHSFEGVNSYYWH
ncbi:uncharacterized protein LOC117115182 [Anneissia japonica]|uniref:uncharacterized protein LOC117115182 n=1 Tax=Anneissia japonica TaxID=1529436 RepID=UPI001425A5F7|nr:uncharacterized protein LOC117115182 [Anneissia japonica]